MRKFQKQQRPVGTTQRSDKIIANTDNIQASDDLEPPLIDKVLENPVGHPEDSIVYNIHERPSGTSEDAALRRLRKETDHGNEQAAELRSEIPDADVRALIRARQQ
jgi:hypothetical protein